MSQSTKIKVIVFMIIFTIICGVATYFAVEYVNEKKQIENNNEQNEQENVSQKQEPLPLDKPENLKPDNSYLGVVLGDRYFENNIKVNTINDKKENLEYKYYEITGLKDKIVEEKINKEIKEAAMQEVEKALKENSRYYYFSIYINANFNNVLSISIEDTYLNYDLSTGEKIKFTELFTNNSEGKVWKLVKENLKRNWLQNQYYETGEYDRENEKVIFDQSGMDEYLLRMYNYYMKNKENLTFYVGNDYITVKINEDYVYIYMEDMYENIAVYNKYLTEESVFENGNLPKEKYCMMTYYENEYGLTYLNEYNDNLFIHTRIDAYNDRLGIILDYYKDNFNKMIDSLKAQADNNKNEAKYVFGIGEATVCNSQWSIARKYTNLSYLYYKEYEYTMSKDEYINNFRDDMFISNIRHPYRGTVNEYNEDKVSYKKNVYVKYNYVDKQYGEIKELKLNEVFVPEYDYISVIKERIKRELNDCMVEGSYYLEEYGKEVFDTALLELEQKTQVDYIMKIGIIELEYNLLYNTITGFFEGEEYYEGYSRTIYISDVLDFNYLK